MKKRLRLIALILLVSVSEMPAYARQQRIVLKLSNQSLLVAMDSLQKSGYRFSYSLELVPLLKSTLVTVQSSGAPIRELLEKLFGGTSISYRVTDKIILLQKIERPEKKKEYSALLQVVKGRVVDGESEAPLSNVSISLVSGEAAAGVISDSNGLFSMHIPIGRQSFRFTNIGYLEYVADNIMVISGKETILNIRLQESARTMKEVVVHAAERKDRALNSMATVSARMLSPEDAARFAGGYNDPSRIVSVLAGVMSGGKGRNNLIIRGNAPKGVLWKLEGIEIPSPQHFARGEGDMGGVFNILTADRLSNFDFFTGAFPAEYGNGLSGIMDLTLRKGNTDKTEFSVEAGMIGTQVAVEGPVSKKNRSSYLVNYRYGNLQFLNKLNLIGLSDNEKPPVFQDISFNLNLPAGKAGSFSLFGVGGISRSGTYRSTDTALWKHDRGAGTDETEYNKFGVLGLKHAIQLSDKKTSLQTVLSFSWTSAHLVRSELDQDYKPIPADSSRYSYPAIRVASTITQKLNAGNVLKAGFIYSHYFFKLYGTRHYWNNLREVYLDQTGNTSLAEAFLQWKHRLGSKLEINTGFHASAFLLNSSYLIEPRVGIRWKTGDNAAFSYGFGLHSRVEPISTYFVQKTNADGITSQPNHHLRPTKAMHHVLGYDLSLSKDLRIKAEVYYQYLYDVLVVDNVNNTFSILNTLDKIGDSAFVNKGKGYNKGIELTLEKFFSDDYYFLLTGSVFDSKYRPANGRLYNTRFNTGYQANGLIGKDFRTGRSKQNIFSVNGRVLMNGGFRYTPAEITTRNGMPDLYYPADKTFTRQVPMYMRFDAGFKFRKNNRHYSWIISLDIQNFTNRRNILGYDIEVNPRLELMNVPAKDLGIIPILSFKVEF